MTTTLNGTARRITTHEVAVKTASVYVKALMIEKHQVTLAVFRQLQEEELLPGHAAMTRLADDTFGPMPWQLSGVPWGRVNYCPGQRLCAGRDPDVVHFHVVWQDGDELRRAAVHEWPNLDLVDNWAGACAYLWLHAIGKNPDRHGLELDEFGITSVHRQVYDAARGYIHPQPATRIRGRGEWTGLTFETLAPGTEAPHAERARLDELARRQDVKPSMLGDADNLYALLRQRWHVRQQHLHAYMDVLRPLVDLDQLFIAV